MKHIIIFIFSLLTLISCQQKAGKVVKELPADSIFHLTSDWQNQNGTSLKLNDLRGKTLVVVMIYTSCKTACPILVADMKRIEKSILEKNLDKKSKRDANRHKNNPKLTS